MLTFLILMCWPWPKDNGAKLRQRRIEAKLDAILKHLNIEAPSADAEVAKLAAAGKKIEAIKLHREITGVGLKEAKDYVESL